MQSGMMPEDVLQQSVCGSSSDTDWFLFKQTWLVIALAFCHPEEMLVNKVVSIMAQSQTVRISVQY